MESKFYCENCTQVHSILTKKYNAYYCPLCDNEIFENEDELREYLDYPDATHRVPFDKSRKMLRNND